jgi:hypothetical protein
MFEMRSINVHCKYRNNSDYSSAMFEQSTGPLQDHMDRRMWLAMLTFADEIDSILLAWMRSISFEESHLLAHATIVWLDTDMDNNSDNESYRMDDVDYFCFVLNNRSKYSCNDSCPWHDAKHSFVYCFELNWTKDDWRAIENSIDRWLHSYYAKERHDDCHR